MIQKRSSTFETNSSSVHAIIISDDRRPGRNSMRLPEDIITFPILLFDESECVYSTPLDKFLYLICAFRWFTSNEDSKFYNIESWILNKGIPMPDDLNIVLYDISLLHDFMLGLDKNPDLITQFIFNPRSKIFTGLDTDNNSKAVRIIKRWTTNYYLTIGWQYYRSRKIGGNYYVYGKGN